MLTLHWALLPHELFGPRQGSLHWRRNNNNDNNNNFDKKNDNKKARIFTLEGGDLAIMHWMQTKQTISHWEMVMLIYFFRVKKQTKWPGHQFSIEYEVIRKHFALVLTNLVVKACQVVRALVVVEALASQANAQGVTSVPSPAWQYFSCPFCVKLITIFIHSIIWVQFWIALK